MVFLIYALKGEETLKSVRLKQFKINIRENLMREY